MQGELENGNYAWIDIKYVDDDNDKHSSKVLLNWHHSANKTSLTPLTLQTTSPSSKFYNHDCIIDE